MTDYKQAILFYNTKSGQSDLQNHLGMIKKHLEAHQIQLESFTIPNKHLDIKKLISDGSTAGVDLIIAAGGDGTVSLVSNAVIGTNLPLGILPLGTGNLLAKELNIPLDIQKALETITTDNPRIDKIDSFHVEGHHYVLNLSIGISPSVMALTPPEEKQKLGVYAYLIRVFQQLIGLKLHRFDIEYDHRHLSTVASEILITNGRTLGFESLKWSETVSLNDNKLDLFIIRARNIIDILGFLLSIFRKKETGPVIKYQQFSEYCRIEPKTVMNVQADGDIIGQTPVEVHINPLSLNIITGSADNN